MAQTAEFQNELSAEIWDSKYRYYAPEAPEASVDDTWRRVAAAIAAQEADSAALGAQFLDVLRDFRFLPGGRILAGAGTEHAVTLCNCFVMGRIDDSMDHIFERLKESALTMQWGGGIGLDFSTLRPLGSVAATRNTIASGPVSFMAIWDAMCGALMSTGARRGAMMGTLRCDHPDVQRFIGAKRISGALTNFNLSLLVTDAFMDAIRRDGDWQLTFPAPTAGRERRDAPAATDGSGDNGASSLMQLRARDLWGEVMAAAYDTAEPGVLFIDRINELNNLYYREHISATNPCGEVPLPPYGACVLGSVNLTAFVNRPFSRDATLDSDAIAQAATVATRFLDNVIDCSQFPLAAQRHEAVSARRIGLGITGLADALMMLGFAYDTDRAREIALETMQVIRDAAYRASIELAKEKGAFPYFERDAFLDGGYVQSLPTIIKDAIADSGIRNSHLIAIAPTGTISLLANNVSSGIEPVFAYEGRRRVLNRVGEPETRNVVDYAYRLWHAEQKERTPTPAHFRLARELPPEAHLLMQAALQPIVDNSISKTINVPESMPRESFASIYARAFELGLKGCTVFRPTAVRGEVLSDQAELGSCCPLER